MYEDELAELEAEWAAVPEPDQPPRDGTYAALITRADIIRGKQDPTRLFVALTFAPDAAGGEADLLLPLNPDKPERLFFSKKTLRRLGFDAARPLRDLETWLPRLVGGFAEIVVKTNGQYTNVYVNRRLERLPGGEDVRDDIPF